VEDPKLARFIRAAWAWTVVVVFILILGAVADAAGAF
jgi:hypothetical protein